LAREEESVRLARIEVLEKELGRKRGKAFIEELCEGEPGKSFVDLLGLYKEEQEYLVSLARDWEKVRTHYPGELENLLRTSRHAEIHALVEHYLATGAIKFTSKQKSEWKRSMVPGAIGRIEREFGLFYFCEPTCLDRIFRGGVVTLRELEELFGIRRQRFPGDLPHCGREYGYRAVLKILDVLLSEEPCKGKKRGRPHQPWLTRPKDPGLRERVLCRIEARIQSLPGVPKNIAEAFLAVVRRVRL
jgi:hypothetical protein